MKTKITLTQEDLMLLSYILKNMNHNDLMAYCKRENNSDINYLINKFKKQIDKNYSIIENLYKAV